MNVLKPGPTAESRGKIIEERVPWCSAHSEGISTILVFWCSYSLTTFNSIKMGNSSFSEKIETLSVLKDPSHAWSWTIAGLLYVLYHSFRFLPVCHIPAAEKSVFRKGKSLTFSCVVCEQYLVLCSLCLCFCRENESLSVFLWVIVLVNFCKSDLPVESWYNSISFFHANPKQLFP